MPYNSETSAYERRAATVIDATPDGDTVSIAIDVKLDQGIDDYVTDLNHHAGAGYHYPAPSVGSDSRFLKQTPAGVVSWADGVVAADAALKDFSNVASGAIANDKLAAIAPAKITQDASNRFVTDTEKTTWNGALYDKADVEGVLTGTITSHTHSAASEGAAGLVELATTVEAADGVDTSRAVTAAGMDAYHKATNIINGAAYTANGLDTSVSFGSGVSPLPSGIKRVTVAFTGVSVDNTSNILVRIGNGAELSTGYLCSSSAITDAGNGVSNYTGGFGIRGTASASDTVSGLMTLHVDGGRCTAAGAFGLSNTNINIITGGSKTYTGTLDRVIITTVAGTGKFDAGTINIAWEF